MANVKVKLLRPLNGQDIGTVVEYEQADADRLAESGAVQIVRAEKAEKAAPENKAEKSAPANKSAGKGK